MEDIVLRVLNAVKLKVAELEVRESNKYGELSEEDHAHNECLYIVLDALDETEQEYLDGTLE